MLDLSIAFANICLLSHIKALLFAGLKIIRRVLLNFIILH
jgi:hypothetical protein